MDVALTECLPDVSPVSSTRLLSVIGSIGGLSWGSNSFDAKSFFISSFAGFHRKRPDSSNDDTALRTVHTHG